MALEVSRNADAYLKHASLKHLKIKP
jgi:hypothetical protein